MKFGTQQHIRNGWQSREQI